MAEDAVDLSFYRSPSEWIRHISTSFRHVVRAHCSIPREQPIVLAIVTYLVFGEQPVMDTPRVQYVM